MGKGPGYNMEDLVFYGMLFLGIILTYKLFEQFAPDVHRILRLLVSLVVGLGIGWVAVKLYQGSKTGGQDEF
jgi:uncharacterized membrane protein